MSILKCLHENMMQYYHVKYCDLSALSSPNISCWYSGGYNEYAKMLKNKTTRSFMISIENELRFFACKGLLKDLLKHL